MSQKKKHFCMSVCFVCGNVDRRKSGKHVHGQSIQKCVCVCNLDMFAINLEKQHLWEVLENGIFCYC